jgi:hypothetical protein
VSVLVLFAAVLLSSCDGSYTDPLDGQQKKWQSSDDPTPEEAKRDYAELERHKGLVDALLTALRAGPQTPTALANIASCLEHLERIAEAKTKLAPRMR